MLPSARWSGSRPGSLTGGSGQGIRIRIGKPASDHGPKQQRNRISAELCLFVGVFGVPVPGVDPAYLNCRIRHTCPWKKSCVQHFRFVSGGGRDQTVLFCPCFTGATPLFELRVEQSANNAPTNQRSTHHHRPVLPTPRRETVICYPTSVTTSGISLPGKNISFIPDGNATSPNIKRG